MTSRAELMRALEGEVSVLIRRVKRVVAERAASVHPDLHGGHYLMLTWLQRTGPARGSELVDAIGIDKGAVSRSAQHLVALGLVERTPDPDDRRASLLSVTAEGERRLAEVARARSARFDERLSGLSDDDVERLAELLRRYNGALEA